MRYDSKQDLLTDVRTAHGALRECLDGIPESRYREPGVWGDGWTVLDLLAHLAEWQFMFLTWYGDGEKGEAPRMPAPGYKWNELPRLNRAIWRKHHRRSLASVRADFDSGYGQILELIASLSAEQLLVPGHFEWTGRNPLATYIGPNTASHYRFALKVLGRWLRAGVRRDPPRSRWSAPSPATLCGGRPSRCSSPTSSASCSGHGRRRVPRTGPDRSRLSPAVGPHRLGNRPGRRVGGRSQDPLSPGALTRGNVRASCRALEGAGTAAIATMTSPPSPHLESEIRRRIRRDQQELVAFASDLIRIGSENPPGLAYPACAELIAARLGELGLEVRVLNPSGVGPCVAGTFGEGGRALYFSGHYDVVPAQVRSQFEPVVRQGDLFGRGAADMKGGVAAMAFAIRALAAAGFEPRGRVVSLSVPDEETSGPHGTVALVKAGLIESGAVGMLTMEPTSGVVWNANRGVLSLRVVVHGKPAHVGLHFEGVNAFRSMLTVAALFEELDREVSGHRTRFAIEPEAARRSVLLIGGELAGGHNFNVVPERVSFTVDRRTNPEEDFEVERERLLRVIEEARSRGVVCDAEIFQEGRSAATEADGEVGRALAASIRRVTGEPAEFALCPGALETRHYAALGIPALAYGPGLLSVAHGPEESVSIEKLLECAEIYALAAARLLS